jgi:hypothetical protein
MGVVSRNASCPCGSGLKYKRCCLASEEALAREARFEEAVSLRLQEWAAEEFSIELEAAFYEFAGPRRKLDETDIAILAEWFHSDRPLASGGTPAERYAARPDLPADERAVALRLAGARLGLHRVVAVDPGVSLTLEDVIGEGSVRVRSPKVSRGANRWDILLGRVLPGEPPSLWGPARFFAPSDEPELLAELERLARPDGEVIDKQSMSQVFRTHALALMRFKPGSANARPSFFTLEEDGSPGSG